MLFYRARPEILTFCGLAFVLGVQKSASKEQDLE